MDCDEAAAVGALVRLDETVPNKAIVVVSNTHPSPVIGILKSKIDATHCVVCLTGVVARSGLPIGRLFLGPTGDFASNRPAAGRVQVLGYSYGNGFVRLNPELTVTELAT
jgi:hypothetical protein